MNQTISPYKNTLRFALNNKKNEPKIKKLPIIESLGKEKSKKVAVLMGSQNDYTKMQGAIDALSLFNINADVRVLSAHRQPNEVSKLASNGRQEGYLGFICGAGMAAHLAGVVAAHTTLPVVGVPLSGSALNGVDSLYSTVQMPKGIPVATVAIDNSYNAGILIAQMVGIEDEYVQKRLQQLRNEF